MAGRAGGEIEKEIEGSWGIDPLPSRLTTQLPMGIRTAEA